MFGFGYQRLVATLPGHANAARAGVIGLLLTSMHMTLLGALLTMSPRLLYSHHHSSGKLDPLTDQYLGGAVMLVVGGAAFLAGGLSVDHGSHA